MLREVSSFFPPKIALSGFSTPFNERHDLTILICALRIAPQIFQSQIKRVKTHLCQEPNYSCHARGRVRPVTQILITFA